jgi:hypothetical protein
MTFLARLRPFAHLDHPREVIRQFTPNWFAAAMGTGVLALALPQIPVAGAALRPLGEALWLHDRALRAVQRALWRALGAVRARSAADLRAQHRLDVHRHHSHGAGHHHQRRLTYGIARFGPGVVRRRRRCGGRMRPWRWPAAW